MHDVSDLFFACALSGVKESLDGSFAKAVSTLMRSFEVVFHQPSIEILLKYCNVVVDFLSEGYTIELIQYGLVHALTDAVGLRTLGLRAAVIDVFDCQI